MFTNIEQFGDKIAAIDDEGCQITYCDLACKAEEINKYVNERCVVFSLCENSMGSLIGYVSFLKNRIVPIMISGKIDIELYDNLYALYKPAYLWVPKHMEEKFNGYPVLYETNGYTLRATENQKYEVYKELGLLLTTSGSTGSPKLVRQSYKNLKANTKSIIEYLDITEDEKAITTLPMSYTYGLSIINTHIESGATVLLTDKTVFEKGFWEFFKMNEATSFGGVPYTYEILQKLRFFKMDLPSLRYMTQAGGKLSPELHKKFAEYAECNGKKFIVMYGQTEATARMAYLPSEKSIEKYGSMGIAIPGGKFELIDMEGNIIETPETVGELVYKGDNVTLGYAETLTDLNKGDERNGVLVTGDMAKYDEDGYYFIVGRKKRFLKVFGNRINMDELEGLLKKEYTEYECVCSGIDDNVIIYVVRKQNLNEDNISKEIKSFVSSKTHISSSAFTVKFIEQIPKNEAGKILYSNLD